MQETLGCTLPLKGEKNYLQNQAETNSPQGNFKKLRLSQLTGREEEKLRLLKKVRPKCKLKQGYQLFVLQQPVMELVVNVQTWAMPWLCFVFCQPAATFRPHPKGDVLQNAETLQRLQLAQKKPGWRNGWIFEEPHFGSFPLWDKSEHRGVCKAFLLPMPNHPHTVLYIGNTFMSIPSVVQERMAFMPTLLSQHISQEPQASRDSSRHPQHCILHEGRIFSSGD